MENTIANIIRGNFPDIQMQDSRGMLTIQTEKKSLPNILKFLKETPLLYFDHLSNITAVDKIADNIFELIYHLFSKENKVYIAIKTNIPRDQAEMSSITSLWRAADWLEREVYDMFGIKFTGHPDLRRILMWDGYEGFPLRKDFTSPEIIKLPEVR